MIVEDESAKYGGLHVTGSETDLSRNPNAPTARGPARPSAVGAGGCPAQPDQVFRVSLVLFVVLKLVLMSSLPLIVTYDSMHYLALSELWDGTRSWDEWHFGRTPAFPYYLRSISRIFGLHGGTFITCNTLMGIATGGFLALLLRRHVGRIPAIGFLALMLAHPLQVGYEHVLLTEATTACMLALIMLIAATRTDAPISYSFLIGSVVGLAYMTRQTFVAMIIPVLLVSALMHRKPGRTYRAMFAAVLVGSIGYAGMTVRWQRFSAEHDSRGIGYLLFLGALNYGLIDSSIEEFAPARVVYDNLRHEVPEPGDAGYTDLHIMTIRRIADRSFARHAGSIAVYSLLANPLQYVKAVAQNLRLLYGASDVMSENAVWPLVGMREQYDGNCRVGEPYRAEALALFDQPFQIGAVARTYGHFVRPFRRLVLIAALCSLVGGITMLMRRDWVPGILNLVPHLLIVAHAVLLVGIDRYAFPMYPAVLCMGLWSGFHLVRSARLRLIRREPQPTVAANAATTCGGPPTVGRGVRIARVALTILTAIGLQVLANFVLQPSPAFGH